MFSSVQLNIFVQSKIFSVATCSLVQSNKIILFYFDLVWSKDIRPIILWYQFGLEFGSGHAVMAVIIHRFFYFKQYYI